VKRPDFRPFVPAPGKGRGHGKTPREHARAALQTPRAQSLFGAWEELYKQPFKGITTDGNVVPGLFALRPEGAPTQAVIEAAMALLARLTPEQTAAMTFGNADTEWWAWQNTELWVEDYGLRLDAVSDQIKDAVLAVMKASLSVEGYGKTRDVMRLNAFLGNLVGAPEVLSEWAYIFCLFGAPSTSEPWGWQIFGHHLCLNCMIVGEQMVLTPTFMGAEPSYADAGPFAGTSLFEDEERKGLALMRSLPADQQARALVYRSMKGGDVPEGRWHFADHLHLGGAHRDNRVVPYEGLPVADFSGQQKRDLVDLVGAYLAPLPEGPLSARLEDAERHLADTHFCWIGNTDAGKPFYYRIQSPVVMIEFDHHSGVFLTNPEPATFHVHTIVRTPNGNDYGMDLLRLHYENAPHHQHHHDHEHGHKHDGE
jgi:hypothetical protein